MLIKTRYHNISVRMAKSEILTPPNADKDVEQWELSLTASGDAKWWRQFGSHLIVSTQVNVVLPYNLATRLMI